MADLSRCFNIADLRAVAKRRLPKGVFEFVDRGAEDEVALHHNREAFERLKLIPRSLIDVSDRSMETELFGKPMALPIAIAPTGAAGLCWHEGELALAKAAAKANIPFTLATGSITAMEKIAEQAGGRLWFQLYLWKQRELSFEIVERARRAGFEALILTVDSNVNPNREYNARNGFGLPFNLNARVAADMLLHPGWFAGVLGRYLMNSGMPRHENFPAGMQRTITSAPEARQVMRQDSLNWDDLRRLRELWPGTLMVKGIMRGAEAIRAAEYGADGIVVSNHGGRNLDSALASIEALPEVVEAVGHRMTVLLDSGIRRGTDIVKALALGAKAVLVGRATLYGTAAAGEAGAAHAITMLRNELDKTMAYTGCRRVTDIDPDLLFTPEGRNRMAMG